MDKVSLYDAAEAINRIAKTAERMESSVLAGWSLEELPTDEQVAHIVAAKNVLVDSAEMYRNDPPRAWNLAGRIVSAGVRSHRLLVRKEEVIKSHEE